MSTANESGDEAACRDLCPDAETAVYLENKGSDDINDSISKTGRPYSELPTALRYRTAVDKTCVCHHDLAPRYSIAKDATLRKGDGVMTAKGLVVYDGGREFPHSSNDFVAVDNALLPAGERAELLTMQQHGLNSSRSVRVTTP